MSKIEHLLFFLLCDIKRIIFWFRMFFLRLKFILKKSFLFFWELVSDILTVFSHINPQAYRETN